MTASLAPAARSSRSSAGDGPRVVEAGVAGGSRASRAVTASLAPASRSARSSKATARGSSRLAWPAGSRASRAVTASLAPAARSVLQQPGDGPRVVEADVADGPLGGARGVAWADLAQVGDELAGGVGAPQSCRCCP